LKQFKHKWTDAERDVVRCGYNGTNNSADQLARELGVTRYAVKGQAQKMGLCQNKSPRWTNDELDKLYDLIHQYPIAQIAKRLRRTPNAVKVKATRLHLGLRVRDGWFTKREVCEILGVDHRKIQTYITSGVLKASWHNGRRPQKSGTASWHISEKDLRDFIIANSGDFLGRNVDLQQIVWIVSRL